MPYTFKMLAKHLFMWEVQDSNKVQFLHTLFSEKSCLVGKANRKAFGEFHTSEIVCFVKSPIKNFLFQYSCSQMVTCPSGRMNMCVELAEHLAPMKSLLPDDDLKKLASRPGEKLIIKDASRCLLSTHSFIAVMACSSTLNSEKSCFVYNDLNPTRTSHFLICLYVLLR